MRWYRLTIGNDVFEAGQSNLLSNLSSSSAQLNIQFNISIYDNNASSTLGTINVYNASLEWFLQTQAKKGQQIKLEAGFNESSPLIQRMGYSKNLNSTLLSGEVQNIIGDFSGIQSIVTIYFTAYTQQTNAKTTLKLAVKAGDKPAELVCNYLNSSQNPLGEAGNLAITFTGTSTASQLVYNSNRTINGNSLAGFLNDLATLTFKDNAHLYYTIQSNGTCVIYSDLSELKGASYAITARDFVKMPCMVDFAGTLQAIVKLSPHYKVGDYVSITGVLPELQGAYSNIKMLSPRQDTTRLFYTGRYIIKSVNHIGEYYNISPDSWTTQLELTPDEATTKQVTS